MGIFPTLAEELQNGGDDGRSKPMAVQPEADKKKPDDNERDKLKSEWLDLLFTNKSVAAQSPEGPLPVTFEAETSQNPNSLCVWIGDQPEAENDVLKALPSSLGGSASFMCISWSRHPAGEGLMEFNLNSTEVTDGVWYLRERSNLENEDLDMLHDVELLGRSMVEAIEQKLGTTGLDWKNVVLMGFGKGAGLALYAALLKIVPKHVGGMIFFSPVVPFPSFMAEKMAVLRKGAPASPPVKMFTVWGNRNRSTPGSYRQLLAQAIRKATDIQCTPDTLPDGDHSFSSKGLAVLTSLLPLCLPR